jgi:putative transposase
MPASYIFNRIHIVFSTKRRQPFFTELLQPRIWGMTAGIAERVGLHVLACGGFTDHVHLLVGLPATIALSDAMRAIKTNTSSTIRKELKNPDFGWQDGFAAFSIGPARTDDVIAYIRNQAVHHRKKDFAAEFDAMVKLHRSRGLTPPAK